MKERVSTELTPRPSVCVIYRNVTFIKNEPYKEYASIEMHERATDTGTPIDHPTVEPGVESNPGTRAGGKGLGHQGLRMS